MSFYLPGDIISAIRKVCPLRGDQSAWLVKLARPVLTASGALRVTEEDAVVIEFREALATQGVKAVRAKLLELSSETVESLGGAVK